MVTQDDIMLFRSTLFQSNWGFAMQGEDISIKCKRLISTNWAHDRFIKKTLLANLSEKYGWCKLVQSGRHALNQFWYASFIGAGKS